ncbi:MAG: VOC family protein [Ruminiclostridium sp.]
MKIEHVALWTKNLEESKNFYTEFFNGKPGKKYVSQKEDFKSYFINFDSGTRLEIMQIPSFFLIDLDNSLEQFYGYSHFSFSVGSKANVDQLTEELRARNFKVVSEARSTGDGYYESCILDPDNNRVEITV